ncbi:Pre-mRNA-splicing factor CWC25 [Fusarium oxysporum f. sp. albedinis]|nr:Pre-mRNA-splicing factor CWC25 [Fusarium oxysporum f. sp. albedinis]
MTPPSRQRNPALAGRPGRLKLSVEEAIRQASSRSRSPTTLSPISKDRSRRRSSSSTTSHTVESFRRRARSDRYFDPLGFQTQANQHETSIPFPPLGSQDSSPFPRLSVDESAVFTDEEPPSQGQSPIAQLSGPNWQTPAQPLPSALRTQSARVKDGQMIRVTLKTQTTEVPCIAKCYLTRDLSVVDNDFARNWGVKIHPVPKPRWKDARHWCVLDVIDVETIGSVQKQLSIRLGKLPDQRVSVELGIDALKALHLVDETANPKAEQLSRSAPPSQYLPWTGISPPYMQQPQDILGPYVLTPPAPQQFPTGRNRALTVPSIPSIRIDTSFDTSLSVPKSVGDSGSGEDSSSPWDWDALSIASQSYQEDDPSAWSPAVSDCGGLSFSFDTCMK